MNEIVTIIIVMGIITMFAAAAINYRFKEAHYQMWLADFEKELGGTTEPEDRILLRELFDTNHLDIKWAVETYREVNTVLWETKKMSVDEILERYSEILSEEELQQIKKRKNA